LFTRLIVLQRRNLARKFRGTLACHLWREVEGRIDYPWTVRGTLDTEIEALLGRLTDEIRRNSDDSLVGLYVYGSLVTGDFDKDRSDIDLLAVVDTDLDGDTFGRLERMHARLVEDHPAWKDRIEVAYVPAPAVGINLYGPLPDALIPEISQSEFVEAVREQAVAWKEWVYRMRTPGAQSYAVLTMCRALYAHAHGTQASKQQAALWAAERLPEWEALIQQSVAWMSERWRDETDDVEGFSETVRFVHDVADRITGTGGSALE
jgi:predicted nucleotidyltransferase